MPKQPPKVQIDWDYKSSKLLDADIKKEFKKTGASMLELLIAQKFLNSLKKSIARFTI